MAKKIVSFFAKERVKFLILSFFVSLGILIPLHRVYAIFGIMGGIADAIGKAIAGIILAYMLSIPTAILWLSSLILGWSIDPLFIRIPYTSGGIIEAGWPVTRDLANMGIVLALVFIGLATALRIREYQAQKTLPLLIGVALLINFTPVILGVIVDASNIVMRFFLDGLTGGQIVATIFSNISTTIAEAIKNTSFFNVIEFIGLLAAVLMIGAFMIFASILFLLFAMLFIMRKIAIWILVILSPLAFAAYILPGTRGYFRMWWSQFIQWTIIGIFAAFFLWLGNLMIGMAARGGLTGAVSPDGGGVVGDAIATYLNAILPYMVALIFLLIGFFVALSSSAMGASGIVSGVQKGVRVMTKRVGREAWEKGKIMAQEKAAKSPKWRRISERMAMAKAAPGSLTEKEKALPLWKKAIKPKVLGKTALKAMTAPAWAVGRAVGKTSLTAREAGLKEVQRKEGEAKTKWETPEMKLANLRSAATKTERVAIFNAARDAGQLKPLEKLGLTLEERENIGREALEIHPQAFQKIRVSDPILASKIAEDFPEEIRHRAGMTLDEEDKKKYNNNIVNKIIGEMKAGDVEKMAPSSLKNAEIQKSIHAFWGGPQISAAGRAFGREFIDIFNNEMQKRGKKWYDDTNPKALHYVGRTTAQELGFSEPSSEQGKEKVPLGGPPPPSSSPPGVAPPGPPPPRGRPGIGPRRPRFGEPPLAEEASPPFHPKERPRFSEESQSPQEEKSKRPRFE